MSRLIRGERDADGNARVYVDDELLAPDSALWHTSLCLRNLSPTGPEWGYDGRGPAQLAIVILLAVTDTEEAQRFYPLFRSGVLADEAGGVAVRIKGLDPVKRCTGGH